MSYGRPTYETSIRYVVLLTILRGNPDGEMSVADLAARLSVSERTIKRYAQTLSEVNNTEGAPIVRLEHRGGRPWVSLTPTSSDTVSQLYQYAAVDLAAGQLRESNAETVSDILGAEHRKTARSESALAIERSFHYLSFGPKTSPGQGIDLESLLAALLAKRRVWIRYRADHETIDRHLVEPYTLVAYRDGLYLVARRVTENAPLPAGVFRGVEVYPIDSLQSVEQASDSDNTFEIPKQYSPDHYFAGQLGVFRSVGLPVEVDLLFAPSAASKVRGRRWPGIATWCQQPDGKSQLSLRLPLTSELVTWIISWGPEVEVLAPTKLRRAVAARLEAAAKLYDDRDLSDP